MIIVSLNTEFAFKKITSQMAYVGMDESTSRIVEFVRLLCVLVKIDPGNDFDASLPQALGHTTSAAKEIYCPWHNVLFVMCYYKRNKYTTFC